MKQSDPNTNREQLQTYCLQLLDMKQISMNHQQITTVRQHATKKKNLFISRKDRSQSIEIDQNNQANEMSRATSTD